MGGKALLKYGIETERRTTPEFLKIANYFQNKVENGLGLETYVIKYFRKKETHGDLDILIKMDKDIDLKKYVQDNIETKAIHHNTDVLSFEFNNFQIDFISIKPTNWETSKCFFDFDPSGNLMCKTAHMFGVKYGVDGLMLPIRGFNKRLSSDVFLTKDNRRVFEFLGYNYDKYLKGFDTKEEIFNWIIDSKYYDSEMFQMDRLNHIDRKRNLKRVTYGEFLEYIKGKPTITYNFKSKEEYLERIEEYFPEVDLKGRFKNLQLQDDENQEIIKKFNGNIIMGKYNWLKGKELGDVMNKFKSNFDNFKEYILKSDTEKVMKDFDSFLSIKKIKNGKSI